MSEYTEQAEKFLNKHNIKFTAKFIKHDVHFPGEKDSRDIFKVGFSRNKTKFSLTFGQSMAKSTGNGTNAPKAYDVLACLTKYDPGTFESFCSDFGYDTDSRTAEKIYKNVIKEWQEIEKFFTSTEIEELQEIN